MKLLLVVACALINENNRILLGQRKKGDFQGLWEFPGGKLHEDETPEEGLVRELHEELGIIVDEGDLQPITFISTPYKDFHLMMPLFACHKWIGTPSSKEDQMIQWTDFHSMITFPMPPGDEHLREMLLKNESRVICCCEKK